MDWNIDSIFNKYSIPNDPNATYKPIGYYI